MSSLPRLVVATGNAKKGREIREILAGKVVVETLADYPDIVMPPESADTFEGNARIKAEHVRDRLSVAVLADDSGLEVDALDGRPGVYSARYVEGSDADRYRHLLVELEGVPDARRTARFACAMAFARPGADTTIVRGACEGRIGHAPRGEGGFGYDPVFMVEDGARSMAELSSAEKARISHRGEALRAMAPHLDAYFSLEHGGTDP